MSSMVAGGGAGGWSRKYLSRVRPIAIATFSDLVGLLVLRTAFSVFFMSVSLVDLPIRIVPKQKEKNNKKIAYIKGYLILGGETGIRTLGPLAGTTV